MSRAEAGKIGYSRNKDVMEDCRRRQKEKALNRHKQLKKKCPNCKIIIPYEKRGNKFCSFSCAAIYNNKRRKRKECKVKVRCLFCGDLTSNEKFCKIRCQHDYRWAEWKRLVINTGGFPNLNGDSSCSRAKRLLIELRGHQCEICGTNNWMGMPIPLVFDHIDGDSSNWLLNNCRIVCGNCDMQLPTYKNKNKKSARIRRYN